jgi:hypothetical protein
MIAILVLCSAAGAAPLRSPGWNNDSSAGQVAIIGHDLRITQDAVARFLPDEPEIPLVTTSVDSDFVLSEKELANREPALGRVPPSDPPAVMMIALGFTLLGGAGIIGRMRTERRRRRRRTLVHIRAIIATR